MELRRVDGPLNSFCFKLFFRDMSSLILEDRVALEYTLELLLESVPGGGAKYRSFGPGEARRVSRFEACTNEAGNFEGLFSGGGMPKDCSLGWYAACCVVCHGCGEVARAIAVT